MKSTKVKFTNQEGDELSGRLELPLDNQPKHFALFAHCFTCGKDLKAERNISLALTQNGFAVLRFDFTGLGQSEGNFADTNFSTNVNDLLAAADFLEEKYEAPTLLVGHSLGGTAVLMAGSQMKQVKAIATIAAPCEPWHVLSLLSEDIEKIKKEGKATVNLAGREFKIKSQFVKDLQDTGLKSILAGDGMRGKSILVMHSPQDELVEVSNARHIYQSARHPKSFISLDGANHLMTNKNDSIYAGQVIAAWAVRYLGQSEESIQSEEQVMVRLNDGPFLSEILAGSHHMLADEPAADGGSNLGPTPYEYVASGLGACTAMTIKLYTDRKEWPLEEVKVHLNYDSNYREDCENCEDEDLRLGKFERIIELKGDLDDKQQKRILQIANKCPVHKTLTKGVHIESRIKKS